MTYFLVKISIKNAFAISKTTEVHKIHITPLKIYFNIRFLDYDALRVNFYFSFKFLRW